MLRVIEELLPAWVVGENVAGIVNMALDTVLSDLEAKGYAAGAFIIPACAVDAPAQTGQGSPLWLGTMTASQTGETIRFARRNAEKGEFPVRQNL